MAVVASPVSPVRVTMFLFFCPLLHTYFLVCFSLIVCFNPASQINEFSQLSVEPY